MKKSIAILASLVVLGAANSQAATVGIVNYNNWDSFSVVGVNGTAVDLANTFVQLQYTIDGTTGLATSSATGSTTVAVDTAGGYFDAGTAVLSEAAAGKSVSFTLLAWTGAASYDVATTKATATWTQTVGSWNNAATPPATPDNVALAIPGVVQLSTQIVPEPSTIALGILGAGALLIRRRK